MSWRTSLARWVAKTNLDTARVSELNAWFKYVDMRDRRRAAEQAAASLPVPPTDEERSNG